MTSRKKKLHRRKLESDEEEDEPQMTVAAEETPSPDNNQAAIVGGDVGDDILDAQTMKNLTIEELEAQIRATESKLKPAQENSLKKRDQKAASKAVISEDKAKKPVESSHPLLAAMQKTQRRRKTELSEDERRQAAEALIKLMKTIVIEDNESNGQRKPALKKLLNLDKVTKELRRIPLQSYFLDSGGCHTLADWLYPLPDGTYPNVKVVTEILGVVDTLAIDSDNLENTQRLVKVVKAYAKNRANMASVQELAKRIVDKWSRMIFGISTTYYDPGREEDDEGEVDHRDQYRNLRRKIDRMKQHQ